MSFKKDWKPSKEQHKKWSKIFFENKHLPLYLITTTQAKSLGTESGGMIFVNRDSEKQKIKKIFEVIAQTNQTLALRISGAGGVGKTHFLRYIQHLIKTKNIKRDLDLDLDEVLFDCCIMDAPIDEEHYNFYNIYTQIWEGFGREDFFEEFSTLIFIKLLKILNSVATTEIDERLKKILGDDWRFWKDFNYQEVREKLENLSVEKFQELRKTLENNYHLIIKSIKDEFQARNYRNMFFNILSLIDILIPDFSKSGQFIEAWQLINLSERSSSSQKEEDTLNKLGDLLEVYSWLYPRYVWILALDDLDHLDRMNIQQKLFDLLKIFRNRTKNICIMLTATIDQWDYFDESIRGTDKFKQLKGIFTLEECYFDLDYLPDDEMLDWLSRVIQRWWNNFNIKFPPDGMWYPFSKNAIEFIINYEPNDKTPRSVGNRLIEIWDKLKNSILFTGKLFVESEFDAWRLMSPENYTKLNPFTQELLLTYRIKEKYGAFSGAIEDGIKEIIDILQDSQEFRVVEIIEVKRNKEFEDERFNSKSKKRRADVYFELQEPGGVDTTRIEIQVKAGDPERGITKDELDSSFDLLEYNHIDFLIIISFSELSPSAKKYIERFHGRYNLTATKLSPEQQAFCVLISYFNDITSRKLTPLEAATSFEKIFGISPHLFFRNWLETKKEIIEKIPIFETPEVTPEETETPSSISTQETFETFTEPIQTTLKPTTPEPKKEDDQLLTTMKWMFKKGIERTKQYKNRITKTWLLNRKDCPKKENLVKAWNKLKESNQYGKLEKTTFYIDVKSVNEILN